MILLISFITLFIYFIKIIPVIFTIFYLKIIWIKYTILFLLIYLIFYLITLPYKKRRKLSYVKQWKSRLVNTYPLRTKTEVLHSLFIILLYTLMFIIGILWLRFFNTSQHIDLLYYYYQFIYIFGNNSIIDNILNIFILICILILYIMLISKIKKYFLFQYIRLHIYLNSAEVNFYKKESLLTSLKKHPISSEQISANQNNSEKMKKQSQEKKQNNSKKEDNSAETIDK